MQSLVGRISKESVHLKNKTDAEIVSSLINFRKIIVQGNRFSAQDPIYKQNIVSIMALLSELYGRVHNEYPYDSQILGALLLNEGLNIEMPTGQGKTLTASLAIISRCFFSRYNHVITVNDYLSKRDAGYTRAIAEKLGFTCESINPAVQDETRREAYKATITYIPYQEIAFDFLRDNTKYRICDIILHLDVFSNAIVDESDDVLIDKAEIPVVLAAPTANIEHNYFETAAAIIEQTEESDFEIDYSTGIYSIKQATTDKLEHLISTYFRIPIQSIYDSQYINYWFYIDKAIRAKFMCIRGKNYVVMDNKIHLIDMGTGRLASNRHYVDGMHQSVEAKEKVKISRETTATNIVTLQGVFMMYKHLSGMSGTAYAVRDEIHIVYGIRTVRVMNIRNLGVKYNPTMYFLNRYKKNEYIVALIKERHARGQPILVGSANVNDTEELSEILRSENIPHHVLNAKHHEIESEIVKEAGKLGAVVIATNMAGRGTDIKLGGSKSKEDSEEEYAARRAEVIARGGLFVIGLQRQNNVRIDRQLQGRMGRNNDFGECQFFVSYQDEIFNLLGENQKKRLKDMISLFDESSSRLADYLIFDIQRTLERKSFDSRIRQFSIDNVMAEKRRFYYELRSHILHGRVSHYECLKLLIQKDIDTRHISHELISSIFNTTTYEEYIEIAELDNETLACMIMSKIHRLQERNFFVKWNTILTQRVLGVLDNLWMQFLVGLSLIKRTTFFVDTTIEYTNELNNRSIKLFNEIFNGFYSHYLHIICKIDAESNREENNQTYD